MKEVARKMMAKLPKTVAVKPEIIPPKYNPAMLNAITIRIIRSYVPIFFFIFLDFTILSTNIRIIREENSNFCYTTEKIDLGRIDQRQKTYFG